MKIDSQKLYKDLEAKNLKPVYFLHGDEPYLLNGCVDSFKTAVLSEATMDFNYSLFYAGDADVTLIKDAIETLPVFTPQRLVIVKNLDDLKESELQELESVITNQVTSTVLVLFAEKPDKRKKFYKTLFDLAVCVEFKKPYPNQYPQWISHMCKVQGLKISNDAIHRLHRMVGNNLTELQSQVFRIQDYLGEKTSIEVTDVNEVVSVSREESIFEFTDALGKRDRVLALEQLVNLLDQGQSEQLIVALMARHMRILLSVRTGLDQGIGGAKLASQAGVAPYFIDNYSTQAENWSVRKIEDSISVLHETDKALKSSPLSSHIWLENFVLKSCSL